jgi:putative membrane protein
MAAVIVREKQSYLRLLFRIRGTALPRVWRRIAVSTAIAIALTAFQANIREFRLQLTPAPFALIGFALSIFLGFRNSTSYDRYWEGRKLWGRLMNTCRSIARELQLYLHPGDEDDLAQLADIEALRQDVTHRVIAFAHAMHLSLRRVEPWDKLAEYLPEVESLRREKNVPYGIVCGISSRLRVAWRRGWLHPHHLAQLDHALVELETIQGSCERIRTTPIPFSYTVLIHRLVAMYCLLLPFGMYSTMGLATPLAVFLVSAAFFALDAVADEIEDPFGENLNDLPLVAMSTSVEGDLRIRIGEPAPAPTQPIHHDQLL